MHLKSLPDALLWLFSVSMVRSRLCDGLKGSPTRGPMLQYKSVSNSHFVSRKLAVHTSLSAETENGGSLKLAENVVSVVFT